MSRFFFIVVLFLSCGAMQAQAAVPVPVSKTDALTQYDRQLEEEKKEALKLKDKVEDIDKALKSNRQALKKTSGVIQSNEAALLKLEEQIKAHESEKEKLFQQMEDDYKVIGQLILARNRLDDVPMAALVLKPGAPLKTAQSALVMQRVMVALNSRANSIKDNIQRYQELSDGLKDKRIALVDRLDALQKDRLTLAKFVQEKERLYKRSQADIEKQQQEIARISKQAKDVKDLMGRLREKAEREAELKAQERSAAASIKQVLYQAPAFFASGQTQLPISGIIRVGYGQKDHLDADSKGLWIEGRQNGLVVAPMKGTVRFAGHFKGYGNIVIIEHKNDYHSLVAGLEKIDVDVGYALVAGEPLGYLGTGVDEQKPRLYFELRRRGKAVNPSEKFADIS